MVVTVVTAATATVATVVTVITVVTVEAAPMPRGAAQVAGRVLQPPARDGCSDER